jgi:putative ABC transport system substrate-binding protein
MPVIGLLGPVDVPHLVAAFRRGLAEAGHVEGKNLAIEYRFANFKPELMSEFADDLVRLNMNVIFAATPEAVIAVRNATTGIPIVAVDLESDPVAKGYVKNIARPGGNMTGVFLGYPGVERETGGFAQRDHSSALSYSNSWRPEPQRGAIRSDGDGGTGTRARS